MRNVVRFLILAVVVLWAFPHAGEQRPTTPVPSATMQAAPAKTFCSRTPKGARVCDDGRYGDCKPSTDAYGHPIYSTVECMQYVRKVEHGTGG